MTETLVLHAAEETLEAVHTRRHAAYPAYKPSGVEWLGDMPEHWEVTRLKYVASINDEALPDTIDPAYEFDYVDIGNVNATYGIVARERMIFEEAPSRARRVARKGDTIVSTVRTYLRAVASVREAADDLIVSTGFAVVRPQGVDPAFLSFALRESHFIETVVSKSTGVSYPAINASEVGRISVPVPPLEEQQAIARFLDEQTRMIDDLIEAKRSLLDLLKEKRQAVIAHTVTRGLDPAAKLKPSGVEWLGDVPEHWKTLQIRRLFRTVNGATPASGGEGYWNGDIVWVTPEDLGSFEPSEIADSRRMITECGYQSCGTTMVPAGSLVVSTRAPIGYVGIAQVPMCTNQGCISLVPTSDLDTKYYYYQLLTTEPELKSRGRGSTFAELGKTDLSSVVVASPPLEEQQEIARFLDEETEKIDDLESVVREAIETLELLRAGIISAAVTGKIDVREEGV